VKVWENGCRAPHILNDETRWRWAVSFTPGSLDPLENCPSCPLLNRRLGGSHTRYEWGGERKPPGSRITCAYWMRVDYTLRSNRYKLGEEIWKVTLIFFLVKLFVKGYLILEFWSFRSGTAEDSIFQGNDAASVDNRIRTFRGNCLPCRLRSIDSLRQGLYISSKCRDQISHWQRSIPEERNLQLLTHIRSSALQSYCRHSWRI
jgi:hypothetical protein